MDAVLIIYILILQLKDLVALIHAVIHTTFVMAHAVQQNNNVTLHLKHV